MLTLRMKQKKVALIELTVFQGIVPLVSGYLEAYASQDETIKSNFAFVKCSEVAHTPYEVMIRRLTELNADVYAFSCYVWNMGLVRQLVAELARRLPQAYIILGGPQVMNHAQRYLLPNVERMVICNGEGERTFHKFLLEVLSEQPDFGRVKGLSYYRAGVLLTTQPETRIQSMEEIPSPFLSGLFDDGDYVWAMIETNRGCPFKCQYCFWGAAIGSKVNFFPEDRVKEEITWIAKTGLWCLYIADANWGIRKRDIELSQHIADCKKQFGTPHQVVFSSSKNNPEQVLEITRIFYEAKMISAQGISLQTMSAETLKTVGRSNIRSETYSVVQQYLNEKGMSSYLEIIWPLPGETLESFKQGLAQLCKQNANSFVVYQLLLLNNVELASRREELGLVTIPNPDPIAEAEVVIQTNQVSQEQYIEGLRFVCAVTVLYTLRGLWCLGSYLDSTGKMSYDNLFTAFADFCKGKQDNALVKFCEGGFQRFGLGQYYETGAILHIILHDDRAGFDALMEEFVSQQDWWADEQARALFELDLINRPYIYGNTPIRSFSREFKYITVLDTTPNGYTVRVPAQYWTVLEDRMNVKGTNSAGVFDVDHRQKQLAFMPKKSLKDHYIYCHAQLLEMRVLMPVWTEQAPAPRAVRSLSLVTI